MLPHLASRLHILGGGHYAEAFVEVNGRKDHALTLDAPHFASLEVGYKENPLAYEHRGIVVEGCDA